jgi:regulator of replication initiation timing
LFFVYTKGKDFTINNILKDEFIAEKIAERKNKLKFFIGMIVSEFRDDIGPAPLYSKMNLEEVKFTEEQLTLLSVQGTTLLGMGQKQMPKYLIGPVPVPHSDYFFLAFSYHRLSDESSDPRIQKIGRPTVIFIMLDSVATKEKEMIDFLELFLSHWSMTEIGRQEFIDTEDFDRLFRDIRNTIYLAKDLIAVRNIQQEEFKLLFTQYSTENILLRSQNEELRNKLSHKRLNELKSSKKAPPKKKVNKKKTSKKKT